MRTLSSRTFRTALLIATAIVTIVPALSDPAVNDWAALVGFIVAVLPGLIYVPVLLIAVRPRLDKSRTSILAAALFAVITVAASYAAVAIVANRIIADDWVAISVAGAFGAAVMLVAMRFVLAYHVAFPRGWLLVVAAGTVSQVLALAILRFTEHRTGTVLIHWPTLSWWWLVGEALLRQQAPEPVRSNATDRTVAKDPGI